MDLLDYLAIDNIVDDDGYNCRFHALKNLIAENKAMRQSFKDIYDVVNEADIYNIYIFENAKGFNNLGEIGIFTVRELARKQKDDN